MASSATDLHVAGGRQSLGVTRLLVTGAVTAAAIFVVCWIGTLVPYSSPTHAYIGLFTSAEMGSGRALVEGTSWSALFGGLSGALFALVYNATAGILRR
jgi:hypothetical protein